MIRRLPWRVVAGMALIGVVLLASGCDFSDQPLNTMNQWGENNRRIWDIYDILWIASAIVGALVEGLLLFAIFRYRGRPKTAHGRPVPVHGNTKLEITWTIVPAIVLVLIGIPTLTTIRDLDERPTDNPVHVDVTGHQFFFEFYYPDTGIRTNGELHIPAGRPIDINLQSADVIHSFWVPTLAGKTDAVPGRTNHMWLTADNPGEYQGQCAEFCGLGHAKMHFKVIATSEADYEAWVDQQLHPTTAGNAPAGEGDASVGQQLYTSQGCAGCHSVDGSTIVGPSWQGLYGSQVALEGGQTVTADDAYIHESIVSPDAKVVQGFPAGVMPSFQGTLSDQQIADIIAYMKTLK